MVPLDVITDWANGAARDLAERGRPWTEIGPSGGRYRLRSPLVRRYSSTALRLLRHTPSPPWIASRRPRCAAWRSAAMENSSFARAASGTIRAGPDRPAGRRGEGGVLHRRTTPGRATRTPRRDPRRRRRVAEQPQSRG